MSIIKSMVRVKAWLVIPSMIIIMIFNCLSCQSNSSSGKKKPHFSGTESVVQEEAAVSESFDANALLLLPAVPRPGDTFRILATGGKDIREAKIEVTGPSGEVIAVKNINGDESPYWRIDDFPSSKEGNYVASLVLHKKEVSRIEFTVSSAKAISPAGIVWKTKHGWNSEYEALYSAWVNALFQDCSESSSWKSLSEVTQSRERNFLYNYLSLGEDDPASKSSVVMQPDCADNPFFLRAYFSWKLGLPFGYHICDRGYVGKNPGTGQWITNETGINKSNPVQAFNTFMRMIMNGVHSGTARTSLDNENSDYYPVALERQSLRPGTVYADPYGHTLIIVSWKPQTRNNPGLLLAVDAQPDMTIAIKRFWKGNFLFNTSGVVGEPGFKAFRPISFDNGQLRPLKNKELTPESGLTPFSMQQRRMDSEVFYHTMDRLINPNPLDPEDAMNDLIKALHEQLLVRVNSVDNGEAYFRSHPGTVIPMPSNANAVFLAGGQWENFSTPNRDLRLLIALDAVIGFPEHVAKYPEDYKVSSNASPEKLKERLQSLLDKKVAELSITYTRSDGSKQELTLAEILKRRDAFEMAYNPNDGAEIRWGAPEKSEERSTCRRHAPQNQVKTMLAVRKWFSSRLHPPT